MKKLIRSIILWSGIEVIRGATGPAGMMGAPGKDCKCKCKETK